MKFAIYSTVLILGFLIGTTAGEILYLLLPENLSVLVQLAKSCTNGFAPQMFSLKVINITFGIQVLVNTFSWIGLFISATVLLIRDIAKL